MSSSSSSAIARPQMWKPGTIAPGSTIDRPVDDDSVAVNRIDDSGSMQQPYNNFNSSTNLPIQQQRILLPISSHRREFLYALTHHQVVIVVGGTGSGKSTQLPQYLVNASWCRPGSALVGITQPRRIAATTLAQRVCDERGGVLGAEVGYSVRFDHVADDDATSILFMTDGVLLRESMRDPMLSRYSVIIIDEAHERSVCTDVLMGLLKKILKRRPELRVVISSATIDADKFCEFFKRKQRRAIIDVDADDDDDGVDASDNAAQGRCCILTVEGRQHSVDIFYSSAPLQDYIVASIHTVLHICNSQPSGDILVFLTGRFDIDRAIALLNDEEATARLQLVVLPLYAGLSLDRQSAVFSPASGNRRKVIFSTNVAEASVTIDGIGYVVDSGLAKMRSFDPTSNRSHLTVSSISQSSASQRAGRSGRTRKGTTYRLYTEASFRSMPMRTVPEIQRSNLASVILQLKSISIDNIVEFDFIDRPPLALIANALETLHNIGAIDANAKLTNDVGRRMCDMPIEPSMAKMLLYSAGIGTKRDIDASKASSSSSSSSSSSPVDCSSDILSICAMLSIDNLFIIPSSTAGRSQSLSMRQHFSVGEGDHLSLLNIYNGFIQHRKQRPAEWCHTHYFNFKSLVKAKRVREQLERYMTNAGCKIGQSKGDSVAIRKAIASGYMMNVAMLQKDGTYKAITKKTLKSTSSSSASLSASSSLHIHPSSVLYSTTQSAVKPSLLVYHEIVSTTKHYMLNVSVVEPSWMIDVAPSYFEIRTGYEEATRKQQELANDAERGSGDGDMNDADTDGVRGEPEKKHRRLF